MVSLTRQLEQRTDAALHLELLPDGRLLARSRDRAQAVSVRLTFPWTEPARFLSLRDAEDREFALVGDVVELDAASRHALKQALAQAGFVFTVTAVLAVDEEIEVRHWHVTTRQGERRFQTRLDDWPRALPTGGLLIRDVGGDLYHIPEPHELDQRSRDLLWAFVD